MRAALLLPILFAAVAFAAEPPPPRNLITNGTLEGTAVKDGLPAGWIRFQMPATGYRYSLVSGGRSGRALQIEGAGEYAAVLAARAPVRAGQHYAARGWVRLEGKEDTTATVRLDYYDEIGTYLASTYAGTVTADMAGWQTVAVEERAGPPTAARTVAVSLDLGGKGKALFDDLEMVARPGSVNTAELLTNGNAETVVGSRPVAWSISTLGAAEGTLSWSTERPHDGWYCLSLRPRGEVTAADGQRVSRQSGKSYVLRGCARAVNGEAGLLITFFQDGAFAGELSTPKVAVSAWQEQTVTAPPSAFPQATEIAVRLVAAGNGQAYFDSLSLTAR